MSTPTTPESQEMLTAQFIEAMKPIWPNLTKRQTKLEFITRRNARLVGLGFLSRLNTVGESHPRCFSFNGHHCTKRNIQNG